MHKDGNSFMVMGIKINILKWLFPLLQHHSLYFIEAVHLAQSINQKLWFLSLCLKPNTFASEHSARLCSIRMNQNSRSIHTQRVVQCTFLRKDKWQCKEIILQKEVNDCLWLCHFEQVHHTICNFFNIILKALHIVKHC